MLSLESTQSENSHSFQTEMSDISTSRQQAFASDGDAIFQPTKVAPEPSAKEYESPFISPPTAPQTNPFSPQQQPQQGPFAPDISRLPLLRTGHIGKGISENRNGSPELSIETSSHTHLSTSRMANSTTASLPLIPDIKKENNQRSTFASVQAQHASNYTLSINFSPQLSSAQLATNSKGQLDITLKIILRLVSPRSGSSDFESTHFVSKWYSDLRSMHEKLGLNSHNINFPSLSGYNSAQEAVTDNDILSLQKYIFTTTDCLLNTDHNTPASHEFLNFLDDDSNNLHDKIRMMLLEARMISTMNCCDRLQSRLQVAEKNLTESSNLIAFLRYRVEQLESVNSASRHSNESLQGEIRRPLANTRYPSQQNQAPVTFSNSVDPMFVNNLRIDNGMKNNFTSPENNVNPSQLVSLAEEVLNEKGPLPVGEVGKMLQEATGNPQLSQVLKERHNGLKKFLEKYADKFIMSCDHPFNPHVYLRRSYSPDDQRLIESGSTAFINDKKPRKPRRKEKKSWPVGLSPASGNYQSRLY